MTVNNLFPVFISLYIIHGAVILIYYSAVYLLLKMYLLISPAVPER